MSYMKTCEAVDISFDKLQCDTRKEYSNDSVFSQSIPILYEGARLLFGLQCYQYGGVAEIERYSVCLEVSDETAEHEAFGEFTKAIDTRGIEIWSD